MNFLSAQCRSSRNGGSSPSMCEYRNGGMHSGRWEVPWPLRPVSAALGPGQRQVLSGDQLGEAAGSESTVSPTNVTKGRKATELLVVLTHQVKSHLPRETLEKNHFLSHLWDCTLKLTRHVKDPIKTTKLGTVFH